MKAKLTFDLDDNSDDMALKRCHKSLAMALVIWEFSYNTKKAIEYSITDKKLDEYEIIDLCFKRFYDLLKEHSIDIDELIA